MVPCRSCRASLPDDAKFCNICGYQTGKPRIAPILLENISLASPDSESKAKNGQAVGTAPIWVNASSTEPTSDPAEGEHHQPSPDHVEHHQPPSTYGDHHQPLTTREEHQPSLSHAQHHQPKPVYGEHHQPEPIHTAHSQSQPMYRAHYQGQLIHGEDQPRMHHAKHLKKVQKAFLPPRLIMAILSLSVVSIITISLFVLYMNRSHANANPISEITLSTSGRPIPGQKLQVTGHHFTPNLTVFITIDGQPLNTIAYTLHSRALSLSLVSLSSASSSGTPVTVQADGTFTVTINIPLDWAGSIHKLRVSNQQGTELGSLDLNVEGNQSTLTPTAPSNSTQTSQPNSTSNSTHTPGATPTSTSTFTSTPGPTPGQRILISQQTQSQAVNATGQVTIPGTQATGRVQIANYDTQNSVNLPAGQVLTNTVGCGTPGLQISLDSAVMLSAYSGSGPIPGATVSIHVVQVGTIGNVQDCSAVSGFAYCSTTCGGLSTWTAYDTSGFRGGTDSQSYSTVQQSDIDSAATPMKTSTTQAAIATISRQLQPNEHLVGVPQCTSSVSSDHNAGDQASTVTVTVQTTCTATAST